MPENESFLEKELSVEEKIIEEEFNTEMEGQLQDAYIILSQRQKEAIFLRYHESMEYDQICEIMSINYQSVRNLISTGIKKLASEMKK